MGHDRKDWADTQKKIEGYLLMSYKALNRVPKIREVAERFNLCIRTIKLHKPYIDLKQIPGITEEQIQILFPKWQGKRA